jgi:hypothetical protein
MKKILALLSACSFAGLVQAQVYVLDNFNTPGATGAVLSGTSWVTAGNVTYPDTGTMKVGGTALDDSGWGYTGASINATGLNFLAVTAKVDAGNAAAFLALGFSDSGLNSDAFSISTSLFTSVMSTVYVPVAWTNIDPADIVHWDMGGGTSGLSAFRMTFDNIALSATGAAIPEPSTYAAIFGALALGLVAYRRRQQAA